MSNQVYTNLWHEAQKQLYETVSFDQIIQNEEPQVDKDLARGSVCEMYLQYIVTANKLEECYDQMVQPQKRVIVRKLLDACLGRIVEIKHDLVNIDVTEFNYVDDMLSKFGITPAEAETVIPRYFRREREKELQERKTTMDSILRRLGYYDEEFIEERMTELEAIKIIQTHERARQGRLRAQFMKEIRMLKEKGKADDAKEKADSAFMAAMRIQKMWRGFTARKKIRKRKIEEMILIGMIHPPSCETSGIKEAEKIRQERYIVQSKYKTEYENALVKIKDDILKNQGLSMKEEITDEIRNWLLECTNTSGKLPDFPSEENGGSRMVFSRQGTESVRSAISKSTGSSRESKKSKSKSTKSKGEVVEEDEPSIEGFKATVSSFLPDIKTGIDEYEEIWAQKDESQNTKQRHYEDMIYTDKHREVEIELRKIVDELMRSELENLQNALDRDRAQKGKKAKKAPKKKGKRSGKKGKKKKEKDLTPDRTLESLFEELVANGIIRKYPETFLSSYLGERSLVAPLPRKGGGLGNIRQTLIEYCILPLGSALIHQNVPLVKSIMITGPKGSGKRMLVNAIGTEVGAVLFDLSPANIVGKYPGKSGLIMLMHLVSKVSRLLQPAIIYMEDAEKPFMKKVPKTDKTDPKRLKKDLPKFVKGISNEDQIMLIGTSTCPWEADQKLLQQTYIRYISIPRPSYGCLSFAWKELLRPFSGINKQFDTAVMARISDGYTIGALAAVVKEVITCKRMLQLRIQPLTHGELINVLSSKEPVYKEEEEAFEQWWEKTPLGRKKQRILDLELQAKLEREGTSKKKKK